MRYSSGRNASMLGRNGPNRKRLIMVMIPKDEEVVHLFHKTPRSEME